MAKETLSPHELNKYTYCNYQWYYEKKYGRKQLYDMKKNQVQKKLPKVQTAQKVQKNQKQQKQQKQQDPTLSNFVRGEKYHNDMYENMMRKRKKAKIAVIAVLCLLLVFMGVMLYRGMV